MQESNTEAARSPHHVHKSDGTTEHQSAHHHANTLEGAYTEIHELRQTDARNGVTNKHKFVKNLETMNHELHRKHLLPGMHIVTHGAHVGQSMQHGHRTQDNVAAQHHNAAHNAAQHHNAGQYFNASQLHGAGSETAHHQGVAHDLGAPQKEQGLSREYNLFSKSENKKASDEQESPKQINESPAKPALEKPKESVAQPQPEAAQNGVLLKGAVERAKAGGRPLTITQIGDSHIAFGMETPAIAQRLASDLGLKPEQLKYSSVGDVGKTASYAKDHPGEFMKNINENADLVIVSFGSNEATTNAGAQYKQDYTALIGQIKARDSKAAIAMVGPTDGNIWNSSKHLPYLESVTSVQESVAADTSNAAYLKVASSMGSVATMRSAGLMRTDNLHLTPAGYSKLGAIIADEIVSEIK